MTDNVNYGVRSVFLTTITISFCLLLSFPSFATEEKTAESEQAKTRVGTCEDAKAQSKYWCEERAKVTVVSFGMECENAKKNVIEACEGVKSEDTPYKFNDAGKKKE